MNGGEAILEEMMAENFSDLGKIKVFRMKGYSRYIVR